MNPQEFNQGDVTIFCDGSSLANGRKDSPAAGAAVVGMHDGWRVRGEFLHGATSQQAEIAAAAVGLEALKSPCRVKIFSDSMYVVKTQLGRYGRNVNHAWWDRLDRAASKHAITWEWIKGHAGHEIQEMADRVARDISSSGHVSGTLPTEPLPLAKLQELVGRLGKTELSRRWNTSAGRFSLKYSPVPSLSRAKAKDEFFRILLSIDREELC